MTALAAGIKAPEFSLTAVDGGKFSLHEALDRGPALAAFFKVSCPVCQYAFPYLERLFKAYGKGKVSIIGISQDNQRDTAAFCKEYGVTFRTLLDDPNGYAVSNAYGLTNVPSWFLINSEGTIELSSVGWVKQDFEALNKRLAEAQHSSASPLFHAGEDVKDFRAG